LRASGRLIVIVAMKSRTAKSTTAIEVFRLRAWATATSITA